MFKHEGYVIASSDGLHHVLIVDSYFDVVVSSYKTASRCDAEIWRDEQLARLNSDTSLWTISGSDPIPSSEEKMHE